MSWKIGHVGSKTRSLGQILEKFCLGFRGNLVRMFVLIKSQIMVKMGHVGSKTKSVDQILGTHF